MTCTGRRLAGTPARKHYMREETPMLDTGRPLDPEGLFTITAGGFSATADAFARDPDA